MNWRDDYESLTEPEKQELYQHMLAAPIELRKRSLPSRVMVSPKVFWRHFRISHGGGSKWWLAAKVAASMTHTHLFWRRPCGGQKT